MIILLASLYVIIQNLLVGVKNLFTTNKKENIQLATIDLFEKKKPLYISSDTVQSHKNKHKNITAFKYSLIPKMLEGEKRVFVQKESVYVVVTKLGNSYRLAIKNIKNKNETYVVSLVKITDIKKEIRKLLKYVEK